MGGTLRASTYDEDTLLSYSHNNISNSSFRSDVRELASSMITFSCAYIDEDFASANVTAEDLGFNRF